MFLCGAPYPPGPSSPDPAPGSRLALWGGAGDQLERGVPRFQGLIPVLGTGADPGAQGADPRDQRPFLRKSASSPGSAAEPTSLFLAD